MFGDYISMGESLIITLFSMGMVFLVLIFLSYVIGLLKLGNGTKKVKNTSAKMEPELKKDEEKEDESELIAVLMAAIAAQTAQEPHTFRIRSIQRCSNNTAAWTKAAMEDHVASRL